MQRRLVGSVFVVAAGLLPALVGGPLFALLMVILGVVALREFSALHRTAPTSGAALCGCAAVVLAGASALYARPLLIPAAFLASILPLITYLPRTGQSGAAETWAWGVAGNVYVATPVFAAITLRQVNGVTTSGEWVTWAQTLAIGWPPAVAGLAWALAVILGTWAGDSAAYLTGRAFGRHKLAPAVSPGKTIEGSLGGLIATAVVSALVFGASGVLPWWSGALVGLVIGVAGQLGDLSESFLKRQAGVKDSGSLIPGHGGMLDRIDALLFAFPAALLAWWLVAGGAW
ncbi:MAG: phosphatidate cytidylyltransferase [Thermomicrobiales bacterium]